MRIEVLVDVKTTLGEGPVWDVEQQRLYWIDSADGRILRCTDDGRELRAWEVGQKIGSMALRHSGEQAIVALQNGVHTLDLHSGELALIIDPEPGLPDNRLNDGKVDRQGRFVAGSMDFHETHPVGKLFRLDPDLSVHTLDTGIVCSNGPCWSPDGKTFYFTDSYTRAIWAYDYDTDTGKLRSRRTFATFDKVGGYPDGATVDAEGYVWSVAVYASRLVRFDPNGVVDRIVGLPAFSVTSVIFGGASLDVAYITSMARPYNGEYHKEHEAGMTFAVYGLGVKGIPEPRFKG